MSDDDMAYGISLALGDAADDYDIKTIAQAVRETGAETIDDMPGEKFWAIVTQHALPQDEELSPLDRFTAEVEQAVQTEADVPAVWQRGGVTLEIKGHSRISMTMPQAMAIYRITVAGSESVRLTEDEVTSWPRLWETVQSHLDTWTSAVQERRQAYELAIAAVQDAQEAARKARRAAQIARAELAALQPDEEDLVQHPTMSSDEVAQYLGIAPGSVRRQMSRWEIEAEYERGLSGRTEAFYPRAEVEARAARRPGRGHRSDLD
ncbi:MULTISPECIES: hypothetical protein [unclassified Streptomyces]|uniref:hypothetical protein n=1 Tax=unclassified Streptomyces TaxID=2593676 RepID=UPI00224D761D|nr:MULTISPECIES: hypothetical protein [unclassified Streptomyces]MCX4554352.1 helix-turn-helix domain-containing protein [Streptomyces sp. NBC_01500]WSC25059.1 helix-turn-helix domain-containing protein [Streptomyces sp. NBC_01766]